jgi:hypothetical protein
VSDGKAEEWVLKQVQDRGLEPILFALVIVGGVGFAAGAVLGWWLTQKKTRREIEKIKLENRKASGDIVKELASLREKFIKERELVDLSIMQMRDTLLDEKDGKKTQIDLRACRDQMCSIYVNRYLPAITTYAESIAALCTQPDARVRATTELIPGLRTMCGFLSMLNMEEMLNRCGSTAFKLRREPRDGLFLRVSALLPLRCFRQRWQIRKLRKKTDTHLRQND